MRGDGQALARWQRVRERELASLSVDAKGPLEWLPPSADFACQYASRFWRVVLIYGLVVEEPEAKAMQQQRAVVCGSG